MRLTRNRFRILGGIATSLAGTALLVGSSAALKEAFASRSHSVLYNPLGGAFVTGLLLLCGGVGVCFEFDSDPPPRKDPWEG
jgi:hypothetical protein